MLEVHKVRPLSNRHLVSQSGTDVAELVRSRWRSRAEFTINGRSMHARKQGLFRTAYILMEADSVLVEARRPSSWRSSLVFEAEGRRFEMKNRAWYSSQLVVKADGVQIGGIRARGVFTTVLLLDLPDSLPLYLRVFMAWIALVLRDEAAAAAGAAT